MKVLIGGFFMGTGIQIIVASLNLPPFIGVGILFVIAGSLAIHEAYEELKK